MWHHSYMLLAASLPWSRVLMGCGRSQPDTRKEGGRYEHDQRYCAAWKYHEPVLFRDQDEPRYLMAMILLIVFATLSGLTCLFLKWDLTRANKKILAEAEADGTETRLFSH